MSKAIKNVSSKQDHIEHWKQHKIKEESLYKSQLNIKNEELKLYKKETNGVFFSTKIADQLYYNVIFYLRRTEHKY